MIEWRWVLVAVGLVVLGGCQGEERAQKAAVSLIRPDDGVTVVVGKSPSDGQKTAMLAAKEALFTSLSGRLTEAMGEGPANAIVVCQREASDIAAKVATDHQVKIGRTGVRLRNTSNQAPAWAKGWIEAKTEEPQFAILSNASAAALLPIKLQPLCVMCHGPSEQILPEIKKQLVDRYPADQAVGFQPGELRGWFWVELPVAASGD